MNLFFFPHIYISSLFGSGERYAIEPFGIILCWSMTSFATPPCPLSWMLVHAWSISFATVQPSDNPEIYNIGAHAQWFRVNRHRWQSERKCRRPPIAYSDPHNNKYHPHVQKQIKCFVVVFVWGLLQKIVDGHCSFARCVVRSVDTLAAIKFEGYTGVGLGGGGGTYLLGVWYWDAEEKSICDEDLLARGRDGVDVERHPVVYAAVIDLHKDGEKIITRWIQ